jgi:transketolase
VPTASRKLRRRCANALRVLAMDAVQQANSGHPGMPMGMADIAESLWRHHLKHDPADPRWPDRDRFVLSNGHGSMLLYALLHLSGYALPMSELRNFRQLHSMTPGHPEIGCAPGVETTTGPLGQGIANAVGLAIAERMLAAEFNRPGHTIVDHRTWVFLGDGCLMEGISHEACSLAGTLGLGKLVALYDDNHISIDSEKGKMEQWFTDDTPARFAAYGWHVIRDVDGHDPEALDAAIRAAKLVTDKPVLVCCKTKIGKGSPKKENTGAAHGAPLGPDEVAATRAALGWTAAPFEIPDEIRTAWDARAQGATVHADWSSRFAAYAKAFPAEAVAFTGRMAGELPADWAARADASSRASSRRARPSPPARPRRTPSKVSPRSRPRSSAARPTSRVPTSRCGPARRPSAARVAATISSSACASSAWPRSSTASRCTAASFRTARRSSCSATTRAMRCVSRP